MHRRPLASTDGLCRCEPAGDAVRDRARRAPTGESPSLAPASAAGLRERAGLTSRGGGLAGLAAAEEGTR
jgi:hypothetical protein